MGADFSGWATKSGLKCSDGRTIMPDAFKDQDKMKVPLVWQHQHNDPINILGHAILEKRGNDIYTYGYFNDTPAGQQAKTLVKHGDVEALSIYANKLVEKNKLVHKGHIKEVSIVLQGANPGAFIDNVYMQHGDGGDYEVVEGEAYIYTGLSLEHEDQSEDGSEDNQGGTMADGDGEKTIKDVYDTFDEEQLAVVHYMIGEALAQAEEDSSGDAQHGDNDDDADDAEDDADDDNNEDADDESLNHNQEGNPMGGNVFDQSQQGGAERATLSHAQLETIMADAKLMGSYKKSFLAHAGEYGITDIDLLFPDAKSIQDSPEFIKRRTEWVDVVLGGTKHTPFSRIKTMFADITEDEARAKGYIKGNVKKDEFFGLSKRVTTPQTIYKKQKLDRDDIIDITDLDVVAWLKAEMRLMLEEELARAILIGDGREVDDDDKIKDPASNSDGSGIRSIAHDADLFATRVTIPTNASPADSTEAIIRSMDDYHGSGAPTAFMARSFLTDLLLQKDKVGRRLYRNREELASELGVSRVVDVEILNEEPEILAIIVNLQDYSVGTDRGGETNFFDDFDLDVNQYKYLYETRASGALTKWKAAVIVARSQGTLVTPNVPTFNATTGVVTIVATAHVVYKNQDTGATLSTGAQTAIDKDEILSVVATPASGYYFPYNFDADWDFIGTTDI